MTFPSDSKLGSRSPSIVCGGCGCWCDDIEASLDGTHFRNACSMGSNFLAREKNETNEPTARDHVSSRETLLQTVVERFASAKHPLITGLSWSSLETIRLSVAVADRCRGVIDPWQSEQQVGKLLAFQQSGEVSATWGEVKNRADVVIYWRCQPQLSPRFRHRYGDLAEGALLNGARRQVFVLDAKPDPNVWNIDTDSNEVDLHFIDLGENDSDVVNMHNLLHATRDFPLHYPQGCEKEGPRGTDQPPIWNGDLLESAGEGPAKHARWDVLLSTVLKGKSIAIVVGDLFVGAGTDAIQIAAVYQLLNRWVVGLNEGRRVFTVPFAKDAQQAGLAQSVLTWRTGYPMAVDFGQGFPQYDAVSFRWRELLARDAVDFVLLISGEAGTLGESAELTDSFEKLNRFAQQNPVFEIGAQQTCPNAAGFLQTACDATYWKGRPQTKARPDGVLLPFRNLPQHNSPLPTESEVLQEIYTRIAANPLSEVVDQR